MLGFFNLGWQESLIMLAMIGVPTMLVGWLIFSMARRSGRSKTKSGDGGASEPNHVCSHDRRR